MEIKKIKWFFSRILKNKLDKTVPNKNILNRPNFNSLIEWYSFYPIDYKWAVDNGILEDICGIKGWDFNDKLHIDNQFFNISECTRNDYVIGNSKRHKNVVIRTKGKVHDIKKIFDRLNKEHFNGSIKAKITYGKYGCRNVKRKRSITFGTYSPSELLIRIHPALDSKEVPEYFVEYVIHHEILHEVYPPFRGRSNKWRIHHRAFRIAEFKIPSYKKAIEWQLLNLNRVFFK